MPGYYSDRLSAERLKKVYDIAPPRVRRYLDSEVGYVVDRTKAGHKVIELGCGYGRVLRPLSAVARLVVGIDSAVSSLMMAQEFLSSGCNCGLFAMDAAWLGFQDDLFDSVICIQNGISAFKVSPSRLVAESIRVTRPGGTIFLSSYSQKFWDDRLDWFELQSRHGLLGEIDHDATGDGVIVCKDGFRATTFSTAEFRALAAGFGLRCVIEEVDESSLFCRLLV